MRKVVVITGPTAAGKSELAHRIAREYGGEIIGADSMQIYKGADIATAKPPEAYTREVPYHLVSEYEPDAEVSAAVWARRASQLIDEISGRGALPVVCGGTGQYIFALLNGIVYRGAGPDPKLRARLGERMREEGGEALLAELARLDPEAAAKLHKNDAVRIVRGLELAYSGERKSDCERRSREGAARSFCPVSVEYFDRRVLYSRIDERVTAMLEKGLAGEAAECLKKGGAAAARAIGHKELAAYLAGEESLERAADRLRQATRNYAKRQLTWLRSQDLFRVFADRCPLYETVRRILQFYGAV